jgi:hypothetical protein
MKEIEERILESEAYKTEYPIYQLLQAERDCEF